MISEVRVTLLVGVTFQRQHEVTGMSLQSKKSITRLTIKRKESTRILIDSRIRRLLMTISCSCLMSRYVILSFIKMKILVISFLLFSTKYSSFSESTNYAVF